MRLNAHGLSRPAIVISTTDQERLAALATAVMDRAPDVADDLMSELDRAVVVTPDSVPGNVVRMGSTVTYRSEGQVRRVTLVFPGEADIAEGKISILTPVGTALIGLATGQSIKWTTRDGQERELQILDVSTPG